MRADWDTELCRHQKNRQDFVYSANAAGIDLAGADSVGLKELLEDDTILHMLAGGNTDWRNCSCNGSMTKNIVWTGRLLNPERIEGCQVLHCGNRFGYLPYLVCVEHQGALRSDLFAHTPCPAQIVL